MEKISSYCYSYWLNIRLNLSPRASHEPHPLALELELHAELEVGVRTENRILALTVGLYIPHIHVVVVKLPLLAPRLRVAIGLGGVQGGMTGRVRHLGIGACLVRTIHGWTHISRNLRLHAHVVGVIALHLTLRLVQLDDLVRLGNRAKPPRAIPGSLQPLLLREILHVRFKLMPVHALIVVAGIDVVLVHGLHFVVVVVRPHKLHLHASLFNGEVFFLKLFLHLPLDFRVQVLPDVLNQLVSLLGLEFKPAVTATKFHVHFERCFGEIFVCFAFPFEVWKIGLKSLENWISI